MSFGWLRGSLLLAFPILALAQTSTDINLNVTLVNDGGESITNTLILGQTGSVGPLGNAALVMMSSKAPLGSTGITGPLQVTFELAFNERDTIAISFSESDPNAMMPTTVALSGGTITGGTGAYGGASGSLDLNIVKDSAGAGWSTSTTSGSGTVTVGSSTIPLKLTNFRGWCCGWPTLEEDLFEQQINVSGTLGNGTGSVKEYYYLSAPMQVNGTATVNFSSSDSLILGYSWIPTSSTSILPPLTFSGSILGGTGQYANAFGAVSWKTTVTGFTVSGTVVTKAAGPVITQIKTVYGGPQVAFNTWLEIHGHNLVPANTPASGVDWSNAPDFGNGMMPTQLGPVGVLFGSLPGYIYWYCSAQTNPNCADDQINVLAPLLPTADPYTVLVGVLINGVVTAKTPVLRERSSPAFLSFDAMGHIAARHLDGSLMAPANLYPGSSTPVKAGETVELYGTGFGSVPGGIVAGSANQTGNLNTGLSCWVSGLNAQAVGALVGPGLYQINLTVPRGVPSGDNPVVCIYNFYSTFPGALISVQ